MEDVSGLELTTTSVKVPDLLLLVGFIGVEIAA